MNIIDNMRQSIRRFHESERADIPVGTVLIVAFIVVPLIILLVAYRKELVTKSKELWKAMMDDGADGAGG